MPADYERAVVQEQTLNSLADYVAMITTLEEKRDELSELCRKYHVRRFDVFGSAATEVGFDPERSDLDFLVEFQKSDEMNPADQYFGLWDELKKLFAREVDLVTVKALRNPYFIRSVSATRKVLYAA